MIDAESFGQLDIVGCEEEKVAFSAKPPSNCFLPNGEEVTQKKRALRVHAIKCKCGDILGRDMKCCPGCGKSIDSLLEELRRDFYRINFGSTFKESNEDTKG